MPGRESPGEKLAEFAVLGGMATAGAAFASPLLAVGAPVWLALHGLRRRSLALRVPLYTMCLVPASLGILGAYVTNGDVVGGYSDLQLDAAARLVKGAFDWQGYLHQVAPYAVAGGTALGAIADAALSLRRSSATGAVEENWEADDAGVMTEGDEEEVSWALPNVLGRGVVTLLSAPPGLGKGWWTWALMRALQNGDEFFGMKVRRPYSSPGRLAARWLGAKPKPLKVLWMTEEGKSFKKTAKDFGIDPGLVKPLHRHKVRTTDWPTIVKLVRRKAREWGCAIVIVDTIRAWCPEAEQSNTQAADVMNLARKELAGHGLGVMFVHHDTKKGGEFGAGVAGPANLVGSCDVLVELKRVSGDEKARRMVRSRRYGEEELVGRLEDYTYKLVKANKEEQKTDEGKTDKVPPEARQTFDELGRGDEWRTIMSVAKATGVAETTSSAHLKKLAKLGLVEKRGAGKKNNPLEYRRLEAAPPKTPAPTSNPEYVRYLNSAAWKAKTQEILDRADGACEECGDPPAEGDTFEVHHLTYERVFHEDPEDLIALCSPCHRRAHGR